MTNDLYIGIMTGTSMDAIDVIIARFEEFPIVVSEYSAPFDPEVQKILMDLATIDTTTIDLFVRMHFVLAQEYARSVQEALKKASFVPKDIRAIGLHGQTIRHLPNPEKMASSLPAIGATFQLGSGAATAALTGIDVVSDFRSADVALGGEGAPLIPMFDYHFFQHEVQNRILLNIGGIANLTFLPAGGNDENVVAFDTGPGNMIIDGLAKEYFNKPYDTAGEIAKSGHIAERLILELLENQYFNQPPPKSTGRELFGKHFLLFFKTKIENGELSPTDAVATATELTALSILKSMDFLPAKKLLSSHSTEIIASGGGVKNNFLCRRLQELLPKMKFSLSDELGIPSQAKEALAFAWFAKAFLEDDHIHLPKTTRAQRKIILGSLSKGR